MQSIKRLRFVIESILVLFALGASAQSKITGLVKDKNGETIPYANVVLFTSADTVFIKGAVTDPDGTYAFNAIQPGSYFCEISMVGFAKVKTSTFNLSSTSGSIDLGETVLSDNLELQEVEIIGQKAMIEVRPDKLVFNVSSTPSVSGIDGLELLKRAPGVNVDMDNNVQLLGKSGVRIFINGRPTRLSGTDLANLLQNLGSDNVEDVEIISNPSAKYEAEGDAGIININLKRNINTGFNGNLMASFSQGRYFRNNESLTLNYGGEKVKATFGISRVDHERYDNFLDVKNQNGFLLFFKSDELINLEGYNLNSAVEWIISPKHSLNFSGAAIINSNYNELQSTTDISFDETTTIDEILKSETILDKESSNYNFNINHKWDISETSELSSDFSFGKFGSQGNTYQPNTFFEADGTTVISVSDNAFDSDTYIDLWSAKADYEKEWEGVTLSLGGKYSSIKTDNQFDFFNIEGGEPILDQSRSNDFTYEEKVSAGYAIADIKLNSSMSISGGFRVENTASRGKLESAQELENNDVKRNYTNFFPSISWSYNNEKNHAVSASIGRRITRPNYQNLNPFITPLSELTAWQGNPFLSPSYTMNYQVTYAFKKKLTITNSYSEISDFFSTIFEISGDQSNILVPRNMEKSRNYSLSISYPFNIADFWEVIAFANAGYRSYAGDLEGTVIDLEINTWSFSVQNGFTLPYGIQMDLSYRNYSDWIWRGSVRVKGNQRLDFGFRKSFLSGQLEVRITGSDVFRTDSDYFYNGQYGGIAVDGVRSFDNQRFGAGATWNFGNQKLKKMRRAKGAMDDELRRIEQ